MTTFTPEQQAAIDTQDKNLIVMAGAGSGKTRVLVERYLHLLDTHPDWSLNALVAITFTREAALEMRNRVRQTLETRTHSAATSAERKRYAQLLADMDGARIATIHGLCADILRANAAVAEIDPRFAVLEPIEAASLLRDVVDETLYDISEDAQDQTAMLFTEYDMRQVRDVLLNPQMIAIELATIPATADALYQQWVTEWQATYYAQLQRLTQTPAFSDALDWQPPQGFPTDDKLMTGWRAIHHQRDALLSADIDDSRTALDTIIDAIDLRGGSKSNWGDKATVDAAKDYLRYIRNTLRDFRAQYGTAPDPDHDRRAAQMTIHWYHLLARVRQRYQRIKADEGYLDFNDLEQRTAAILSQHADVRQRYQGEEFKHLLVDEFQDTNDAQWQIVKSLASLDQDNALFVVGDLKQSIYGFRGADVSVFGRVQQEIATRTNGAALPLSVSFRSHPALIDAFNTLFARVLTRDEQSRVRDYQVVFDREMHAFRDPLPATAHDTYAPLELLLLSTPYGESVDADDRRTWEAYEIARRLQALKQTGALVHDKQTDSYRPFTYGDAAILFQSTTNITLYEDVFKTMNVPFVTVAGRGYYNRQEVWDVLNLLKALHNPGDDLSLAAALRSPLFGFDDEMLLALRRLRTNDDARAVMPLWSALAAESIPPLSTEAHDRIHFARDMLHELRQLAGRVTISELLRRALAKTGYLATLTGLAGGARLRRNVEKLVDIAEASGKITLGAFSHYLDDLTGREVREGEALLDDSGAMRLMTVHASKGLEFPVVVLADMNWSGRKQGGDVLLYDDDQQRFVCKAYSADERKLTASYPYQQAQELRSEKEDAERKRLLYVAATRARDCLMMSASVRPKKRGGFSTRGWLDTVYAPLDLPDHIDDSADHIRYPYTEQADIGVHLPTYDADLPRHLRSQVYSQAWQRPQVARDPVPMPRLHAVPIMQERMLGHLSATQLADIGGVYHAESDGERDFYQQSVRRSIFDDSTSQIRDAIRTREPRVRSRQVGEVVHEALRYWRFPDNTANIDDLLRSYAWQQRVTDPDDVQEVIRRAHRLLNLFQQSDLYREIQNVREARLPHYAELPFVFRTDKRILHGMIDFLYQRNDGTWVVLDYKTSVIAGMASAPDARARQHAKRFHLQLGAYASAVSRELNGLTPLVQIHYIQYNHTVVVPADVWQTAIQAIEHYIGNLLGGSST
jgi:ATP-dependent helicase/nuclease subunit A